MPDEFVGDTPGSLGHTDYGDPKYARTPRFSWSNQVLFASNAPQLPVGAATTSTDALPGIVEGPAFIWTKGGHPAAPAFYTTFPQEPILPNGYFKVKPPIHSLPDMTLDSLLDAILKQKSKDILIVAHGSGGGLTCPLVSGSKNGLTITEMEVFAGKLPEFNLDLKPKALAGLKKKIAQVQKMGLRLVVLRACTVGGYPDTLAKLKAFFGCQLICAPKAFDAYGPIGVDSPTTDPKTWEKWLRDHPGATIESTMPNRFAWVGSLTSLMTDAMADSDKAIQAWLEKHLPGAAIKVGRHFPTTASSPPTRPSFPAIPITETNSHRFN
jgi:hypothetical protein